MQQLAQIQFDAEQGIIQLIIKDIALDEQGSWLIGQLCEQFQLQLVEVAEGADRTQGYFHFAQNDYLFNVESLCQAVWIEAVSKGENVLSGLFDHLQAGLQN